MPAATNSFGLPFRRLSLSNLFMALSVVESGSTWVSGRLTEGGCVSDCGEEDGWLLCVAGALITPLVIAAFAQSQRLLLISSQS